MIRPGVYRYVRNKDVAERVYADCWKWAADLGPTHGLWSTLLWWCCGDCKDSEVPK